MKLSPFGGLVYSQSPYSIGSFKFCTTILNCQCQCAFWWPTVCSEPLLFVCANFPLTAIAQVRGLVCVQSPFGGSPIATDIVYGPGLVRDAVHTGLTGLLRGSFSCIDDLTHRSRRDWFLKNKNQVNKVTRIDQYPHSPNSDRCAPCMHSDYMRHK